MKTRNVSFYLLPATIEKLDGHVALVRERDGLRLSRSAAVEQLLLRALGATGAQQP